MATVPATPPIQRPAPSLLVPWMFWTLSLVGGIATLAVVFLAPDSDQAFGAAIVGIGFVGISTAVLAVVVLATTHNGFGKALLGSAAGPFVLAFVLIAVRAPTGVLAPVLYACLASPIAFIVLTPVVLLVEAQRNRSAE